MNPVSGVIGKETEHSNFAVSSRKIVALGSDVQVKEFTLGPGEEVPWHRHSQMFDIFYCLEGRLDIDLAEVESGEHLAGLSLKVSESAKVEAGTAHRPHNSGPGICRFLLVQGIGKYDYIPYQGPQQQEKKL
jgi:quercetin dioxygenase-like cupin family protein